MACAKGHRMVEGNLYYRPDGNRECLTCKRERNRGGNRDDGVRGAGRGAAVEASGSRDVESVPAVRGGQGTAQRLHTVQSLREELARGGGFDERPQGEPEAERCRYTEYDQDTGETHRCALSVHGNKVKHVMGERVG